MPLSKEKKDLYFTRLEGLLDTYSKCFVVQVGKRAMFSAHVIYFRWTTSDLVR